MMKIETGLLHGEAFTYRSRSLSFSIVIFEIIAIICVKDEPIAR